MTCLACGRESMRRLCAECDAEISATHSATAQLLRGGATTETMTKKKRRMPASTESLSDDLRGLRSLKGPKKMIVIPTSTLDRFITKAAELEQEVEIYRRTATREVSSKATTTIDTES